jgi:tetratricopeptide (TPR) repeat protein
MNIDTAPVKVVSSKSTLHEKLAYVAIAGLTFLSPILVLPYTSNLVSTSKWLLLVVSALMVASSYLLFIFSKRKFQQLITPLSWPLLLFGAVTIISSVTMSAYPNKSLIGFGGAYLVLAFLGIFGGNLIQKKKTGHFVDILGLSGAILSIVSLLQMVGWGPSRLLNQLFIYNLPNTIAFSLTGSGMITLQVLSLALLGVVSKIVIKKKLSNLDMFVVPSLILGLVLNVWSVLPGKPASFQLAPLTASWSVAVDSIKELRTALIGRGPESYANTYTLFKPNWVNGEAFWQFNFSSATNFPLTVIVTLGIGGLVAWLLLFSQVMKQARAELQEQSTSLPIFLVMAGTFVIQLFTPTSLVLLSIQAGAIVFWIASRKADFTTLHFKALLMDKKALEASPSNQFKQTVWLGLILAIIFGGVAYTGVQASRVAMSEYYVYQANKGVADDNAIAVYENLQKAVQINPYLDDVRRQYALTNLQIAIALSNNTEINEQERAQVIELISQAINEAKAAATIDGNNSSNWVALAEVYKNIVGVTEGADQWALDSLVQAVRTDPTNPLLRVDIGQSFFDKEQYQEAGQYFNQAIELKPDLAIGYYHLGRVLVKLENYIGAEEAWQRALTLVDQSSEDFNVITKELETIKEMVEKQKEEVAAYQAQQAQQGQAGQQQVQGNEAPATSPSPTQETSLNGLNKDALENQPTITPLTEQNVQEDNAELVNNPGDEPLNVSPETGESLGN